MTRLTLGTVCRILFGEDVDRVLPVVQRTFDPLGDAVRRRAMAGLRRPALAHPGQPTAAAAQRDLHGVCDEIVARRRASGERRRTCWGCCSTRATRARR